MKNLILLFSLIFVNFYIQAQIVDIPDPYFKDVLVNTICVDFDGDGILDGDVDTNNDGEIQISEALAVVHRLFVSSDGNPPGQGIYNLEGIQSFTNLEWLDCSVNFLTNLDVTQNPNLIQLYCGSNQLTSLDVTQNLNLIKLRCSLNQLTSLNVTQNPNLEFLSSGNNLLTSLDVSQNPNLEFLNSGNNPLTSLDVSQNPNLRHFACYHNQLTSLDVTQNPNLEIFTCRDNQLTSLDVTQNPNLNWLMCYNNQLTSLELSQNPNLNLLFCYNNHLASLDISQNPNITQLVCYDNPLNNLNIKNGNNENINKMWAYDNFNLTCIQVDDELATRPPCIFNSGWCVDSWVSYSENCELGITDHGEVDIFLYPNPVQDILHIETQGQIETIKIYSLQGRLVKEVSSTSLDVSQLNSGLYFIQFSSKGKTITKKFIKE